MIFAAELLECLTQPLFFLVLLELVERSLWDPLIRALRVPVRLPRLVWISSGCGSAVVRRSSRSLRGFGVSLPVAWSHPTLARCKAFYPAEFFFQQVIPVTKTYCREDRANSPNQFGAYHVVIRAIVVTVGSILSPTLPPFSICYSFHHPHIHPCVYLLHIFVCPIVQSLKKIPIALLTVLLSCVCVLPVASHHRLHISFVISTPVSVIKKRRVKKKKKEGIQ